jgi:hypothetical protein
VTGEQPSPPVPSKSRSGGKHGPNTFANYQDVHNRRMQDFVDEGFVISHNVRFGKPTGGYITLEGDIHVKGGITVEVQKKLKILSGKGPNAMVKTSEYSYHVYANGRGNLFRYENCDHRHHHHVHWYDFLRTWGPTRVDELQENEVPTLSEVLDAVRDIYYENEF